MKKTVFDLPLYVENRLKEGKPKNFIIGTIDNWAYKCHGLTEEEMFLKHFCRTKEEWMKEIKELTVKEIEDLLGYEVKIVK